MNHEKASRLVNRPELRMKTMVSDKMNLFETELYFLLSACRSKSLKSFATSLCFPFLISVRVDDKKCSTCIRPISFLLIRNVFRRNRM